MYERILVPLDGSPLSESILPYVQSLAKALNAEIILLQVIVEPSTEFDPHTSPLSPAIELKMEKAETREYIKAVCTNLEKQGLRATYLIRDGAVGDMILEVADTMKADMIAMSTHGRTGLLHLLLGSITEWMIKHSRVPVMVIHPGPGA
jgi:nucleotide-binding universal stress UspA family protein